LLKEIMLRKQRGGKAFQKEKQNSQDKGKKMGSK
jgi:hypothetical protein